MKQKLLLLLLFLGICYVGWADEWEDPETHVIYTYTPGSTNAGVKGESGAVAGSPNASGAITIRASITVDGNTYLVKDINSRAFYGCPITSILIEEGITGIGIDAFERCEQLKTITLPNSLQTAGIGMYAFQDCLSLESISIPQNVWALPPYCFSGCTSLKSITLPDDLTSIQLAAFDKCTSLTSITIPASVSNVDESAFTGCSSLTSILVEEGNSDYKSIDGVLFYADEEEVRLHTFPAGKSGDYVVPSDVTTIGKSAFQGCTNLKFVTLNSGLETIDRDAFSDCSSLESIVIPSTVTAINTRAFEDCVALRYVVFEGDTPPSIMKKNIFTLTNASGGNTPKSDEDLDIFVRAGAVDAYKTALSTNNSGDVDKVKELPDVTLNGVKYYHVFSTFGVACSVCGSAKAHYHVGDKSDGGGFDLATMPEDGKINVLGELNGVPVRVITMNSFRNATAIKEVQISDDIVSIHQGAFWGCTELRSINLPSKIDVIASYAFRDCQNLTSINIPEQVKTIGTFSFYNCAALESVTFPEGVTDINGQSFQKCRSLTSVNIPASVTFLYGDAFRQCSSLVAINVDESNSKYLDIDGVLFQKSVAGPLTLQCYPAGKADESYTLPTNVKSVASNAFMESLVKKINIPSGELKTIGSNAFGYADELEEVYISEGVEKVRDGFIYCHSLRHVEIPSSVTVIESGTFFDCTALREVIFKGMTPPEIEKYTFDKEDEVTHGEVSNEIVRLYVPASAINAYIAALEADSDRPKVRGLLNVSFDNESEWATLLTSDYGDETYQLGVPEGTKAYVVTGTDGSAVQTTEIEYLPKGVPVLLKKTGEVGEYIGAARVAVADMTDEQKAVAELADGSIFKGVEEPTDIADISGTKYVLYKDKFIETTSGTLPKNRCYLLLDEAGARVMNIITVGEATGIARVADGENGEKWYSLDGRSLQGKPARKGLYIRNGKKVVVK